MTLKNTPPAGSPNPDLALVSVIRTDEVGLIPLVQMALDQAGIEFILRDVSDAEAAGGRAMRGNPSQMLEEILVTADDESRAREIIEALRTSQSAVPPQSSTPARDGGPMDGATIELLDAETGRHVGRITSAQLQWLIDQLEEESEEDHDYYIDGPTLDMLQEAGADPALILMLRTALGSREGIEIRWAGQET